MLAPREHLAMSKAIFLLSTQRVGCVGVQWVETGDPEAKDNSPNKNSPVHRSAELHSETLVYLKSECTTKSPAQLRKGPFLQERGLEIRYTNSRFSNERSGVCSIAFSIYDMNGMIFLSSVWAVNSV